MLGRRILRIKAFKTLYAYAVTGKMTLDEAMDNLDKSCEATRDLYLYMLAVISPLTAEAAARIKAAKEKFNPTEEDLSPNTKFAENRLAALLDNDPDFQKILSKKGLSWQPYDILIASVLDSVREKEYVESAKAVGTRDLPLLLKYVVPNAFAPILINFTFRTAQAIIQESALSFLGMGVQPPQASWGNILYAAQSITVLSSRPWLWVPPGILLVLTVSSINFVGDGIRDALDSKTKIKKK